MFLLELGIVFLTPQQQRNNGPILVCFSEIQSNECFNTVIRPEIITVESIEVDQWETVGRC